MKKSIKLALIGLAAALLSSCAIDNPVAAGPRKARNHAEFKARQDYRTTSEVYKNDALYAAANPSNTKVLIDLSDQRAQLVVGSSQDVAIDTPVCTGRAGKRTPTGRFPITEKIVDKRSTIYGTTFYRGRRVHGGDRRKYRGPRDKYVGAPLPYWMRLTGDGIGMHGSNSVHRYPASGGCIRTPQHVVPQIFSKVRKGTPIIVTH